MISMEEFHMQLNTLPYGMGLIQRHYGELEGVRGVLEPGELILSVVGAHFSPQGLNGLLTATSKQVLFTWLIPGASPSHIYFPYANISQFSYPPQGNMATLSLFGQTFDFQTDYIGHFAGAVESRLPNRNPSSSFSNPSPQNQGSHEFDPHVGPPLDPYQDLQGTTFNSFDIEADRSISMPSMKGMGTGAKRFLNILLPILAVLTLLGSLFFVDWTSL
ncbi:hypothetical protein ACFYKX_11325 [Cytobacillus sp. FJAT-54145]|uniref:Uncharacterized protein n=1 Tax=Cytobacillus spartinae TaxID=3299023 RepID=A0ABW6KAJ3_9BACI